MIPRSHLAAMVALVRVTLPTNVAEAVLADPAWPTAAGHLHRVDEGLQATHRDLLAIMSAWLTSCSDPAIPSAAHQMIGTIHAATAATGSQLIAQARLS
jgi:hypothetical protein